MWTAACVVVFVFFNDTATTEIYTLSLHDAFPISVRASRLAGGLGRPGASRLPLLHRSEEHTSELQSPCNLVCRLLLENKKKPQRLPPSTTSTRLPCHCSSRGARRPGTPGTLTCFPPPVPVHAS